MFWLYRLFTLPAIVYLCIAPLLLVGAGGVFITDRQSEAVKAVARAAKPPPAVKLEDFNPQKSVGQAQEAILVGQVDVAQAYELTITKSGEETGHYVLAPIYPTNATDASAPATGVFFQEGRIDQDQVKSMMIGSGPIGPVLRIDGRILSNSEILGNDSEFRDHVRVAQNAVYINPFEEGRATGLAASTKGRDTAIGLVVLALLVGLLGAYKWQGEGHARRDGMM